MANVLTGLIPTIYEALDVVSRELIGYIPAVSRDASDTRAALNELIRVPITPTVAAADNTPGVNAPNTGDQTIGYVDMSIQKSRHIPVQWNGEDQRGMLNAGTYNGVLRQQFEQAFRTLTNEIETDLHNVAYKNASRAYGTPGTTPFGTAGDLSDAAQLRKILDDNGAPQSNLRLVIGSSAAASLRGKQSILLKANENGDGGVFRRTGALDEQYLSGFALNNSAAVQPVTKGTGTLYVTSGSTAIGVNSIALVTGSGTVLAGDVVTFLADANNKYVVNTGVAAPGTIVIGNPGARVVIATANAMTIGNTYTPNVGFHRSAVQLIARPPAVPTSGGVSMDAAVDSEMFTDPVSGLTFEVAAYKQYLQMVYHVRIAWGVAAIKPAHIAILQG